MVFNLPNSSQFFFQAAHTHKPVEYPNSSPWRTMLSDSKENTSTKIQSRKVYSSLIMISRSVFCSWKKFSRPTRENSELTLWSVVCSDVLRFVYDSFSSPFSIHLLSSFVCRARKRIKDRRKKNMDSSRLKLYFEVYDNSLVLNVFLY